jgi:hypothetical protein
MKWFMTSLFYLMAILPIALELSVLVRPRKHVNFKKRVLAPGYKMDTKGAIFVGVYLYYFGWCLIGLASSQWLLFLALILLSLIATLINKVKSIELVWTFIDALLSLVILIFILINKFHLHISMADLWHKIVS